MGPGGWVLPAFGIAQRDRDAAFQGVEEGDLEGAGFPTMHGLAPAMAGTGLRECAEHLGGVAEFAGSANRRTTSLRRDLQHSGSPTLWREDALLENRESEKHHVVSRRLQGGRFAGPGTVAGLSHLSDGAMLQTGYRRICGSQIPAKIHQFEGRVSEKMPCFLQFENTGQPQDLESLLASPHRHLIGAYPTKHSFSACIAAFFDEDY